MPNGNCESLLSTRPKVIGKHGAGTDNIDVETARARSIEICSTPGVNADSVADLAIAMALSLLRNLQLHTQALRNGTPLEGSERIGLEMSEVPIGILGMGAIGRSVAARLCGFGSKTSGYDPYLPDNLWPNSVRRMFSIEEALSSSRLLFVHMPLTNESRKLLGRDALASMPAGSYLVNCARGGIVDEQALSEALITGHLAGAASDVFDVEPPPADHPLLAQPNFIATPHLGASTNAGLSRVGVAIATKVVERLQALT